MSLICETIVSEDELSQTRDSDTEVLPNQELDEELDYEEEDEQQLSSIQLSLDKTKRDENDSERDEGELEDDDDLEEGEVKEEDDEEDNDPKSGRKRVMAPEVQIGGGGDGQNTGRQQNSGQTQSICRFYGRGQCTWGNNCRFLHPSGGLIKRMPQLPPPMAAMPPMPPHLAPHPPPNRNNRPNRDFYDNHPIHGNSGGQQQQQQQQQSQQTQQQQQQGSQSGGSESAWERGLKQAKEMIVRASRRKEEEIDFEDKRFNLGVEEDMTHLDERHDSRADSHSSPDISNRYLSDNREEYERRRRLAFESAPWNNDEPVGAKLRQAESYRDPWRRSKSPIGPQLAQQKFRRPPMAASGSRSGSKRSHSMSSISASGSDSTDFSGSEGSEDSFSDSSNSGADSHRRRPERGIRGERGERYNRKTTNEKKRDAIGGEQQHVIANSTAIGSEARVPSKAQKPNPNSWSKGGGIEGGVPARDDNREYDSWSESLSESESISSYYSGSESISGKSNEDSNQDKRIKSNQTNISNNNNNKKKSSARSVSDQSSGQPPHKKSRPNLNAPLSPLMATNKKPSMESMEGPKKSPIKMTFMKKQPNLKLKDSSVAVKLNGGRGSGGGVGEDNNDTEELLAEDDDEEEEEEEEEECEEFEMSPKALSSAASPVSQSPSTPPPPPPPPQSSSSPSAGSSKYEKSLMRRKELLEQLKAVEDAIARKRSKIN